MSRHEGVSCDICLKSNFRGRRYKCLICYDYDLCASCYEEGATSTRHSTDHPMQCILTRADFDLFYAGETYGTDQPQSFTCPYCKRMGFSDSTLVDHVTAEHIDTGLEVVCPVCAALPGGDPNLITDDFAGHLSLEHRAQARGDLISFLDEPSSIRHGGVRRIPHSGSGSRALGGPRSRRSNMHFSSAGTLSALSPAGRDAVDPISELLSQLTGVRRGAPQPSQLQQLQMQIQLERQQVTAARQNLERIPRRQAHPGASTAGNASVIGGSAPTMASVVAAAGGSASQAQHGVVSVSQLGGGGGGGAGGRDISITSNPLQMAVAAAAAAAAASSAGGSGGSGGSGVSGAAGGSGAAGASNQSQFLLTRFMTPTLLEAERAEMERTRADRSQYVQSLLLSTLSNLRIEPDPEPAAPDTQQPSPTSADDQSDSSSAINAHQQLQPHSTGATAQSLGGANENQQQQQLQQQPQFYSQQQLQQQQQQHIGRGGVLVDAAAAAKLKNAAASGGGGAAVKPPPPASVQQQQQGARTASGRQQQQQQKAARDLKASAVPAKESTQDSSSR